MILRLKPIDLQERDQLEPLLVKNPDLLEAGLRVIANQFPTDSGPLDILGVDEDGVLVVIELKNEATDGHLVQGLRYYDWCRQNLPWIAKAHGSKFNIDDESPPRLVLVAPAFTDTLKRVSKYVSLNLQLIEYRAFVDDRGEQALVCTEIGIDPPIEPPAIPTMERKLDYVRDPMVRDLLKTVLEELQEADVEVRPLQTRWISCRFAGKRFMMLGANGSFFTANILQPGNEWTGRQRVVKREDWDATMAKHAKPSMEHWAANASTA